MKTYDDLRREFAAENRNTVLQRRLADAWNKAEPNSEERLFIIERVREMEGKWVKLPHFRNAQLQSIERTGKFEK